MIRPRLVFPSVDAFFILAFWILSIKLVTWLATLSVRHSLGGGFVVRRKKGARRKKNMFCRECGRKVFETKRRVCEGEQTSFSSSRVSRQVGTTCAFEKMQTFDVSTGKARGFLPLYFPSFDLINEIDCPEPQRATLQRPSVISRANFSFNARQLQITGNTFAFRRVASINAISSKKGRGEQFRTDVDAFVVSVRMVVVVASREMCPKSPMAL